MTYIQVYYNNVLMTYIRVCYNDVHSSLLQWRTLESITMTYTQVCTTIYDIVIKVLNLFSSFKFMLQIKLSINQRSKFQQV